MHAPIAIAAVEIAIPNPSDTNLFSSHRLVSKTLAGNGIRFLTDSLHSRFPATLAGEARHPAGMGVGHAEADVVHSGHRPGRNVAERNCAAQCRAALPIAQRTPAPGARVPRDAPPPQPRRRQVCEHERGEDRLSPQDQRGGAGGHTRIHAARRCTRPRLCRLQRCTAPRLLAACMASLLFFGVPVGVEGATFAGIGRVVGGTESTGIHRLIMGTGENGAQLQQVFEDISDPNEAVRGTDPTIGVASWNSVEKFYYYAAAEDGFASAYVTPYSYIGRDALESKTTVSDQTPTQRILRGNTDTSFTLTSLQYNRIDANVYGLITYSSGEHFMVKFLADTRVGYIEVELTFEALLQLDYTHVVPGLSALNSNDQHYFAVGVRTEQRNGKSVQQGYLFAMRTGMRVTGGEVPPAWLWERELPGVLTSLQVDPTTGNLYGMIHNVSGHFLLHFDTSLVAKGSFGDRYRYMAPPYSSTFWKEDPATIFQYDPQDEVIFGIASYAPPTGTGRESESDYFSIVYDVGMDENGTAFKRYLVRDMMLGTKENTRMNMNATTEDFEIADELGYTMTSMQAVYTTIPTIKRIEPSVAHIVGGMRVTIVGEPFVDTGPQIRCRWRLFELGTQDFSGEVLSSSEAYFLNSSVCVCKSPPLPTRMKGMVDLTLTGGDIWTQNSLPFTFFETTLRIPLVGSSKGKSLVQIKGLNFADLPTGDVTYTDERGRPGVVRDKVMEAQCEFGLPPDGYAFNDKASSTGDPRFLVSGNAPVGPLYNPSQCQTIVVGSLVEEVCVVSCLSPPMPSLKCETDADRKCSIFFRDCPDRNAPDFQKSWTACKMLVEPYAKMPFSFTLYGQRVPLGTWAFVGHQSPVIEGARFTEDGTGFIIQFDLDTNKGSEIGGSLDSNKVVLDAKNLLGHGSFFTYILRNRILFTMGRGAMGTDESFFDIRPAALGALSNPYRFVAGSFKLATVSDQEKSRPTAHIIAPGDASQCTKLEVHGGLSSFSGGRPMGYRWGFLAGKCIDLMCLNSVAMDELDQIWLLPAQRALYHTKSVRFDAEEKLAGEDGGTLNFLSANVFSWSLQTTNFFYKDLVQDPARVIKGPKVNEPFITCAAIKSLCAFAAADYPVDCAEYPRRCNKCAHPDPTVCPALSFSSRTVTHVHWTPGPKVKLLSPELIEISPRQNFVINADITVPDDRSCCNKAQCTDRPSNSDVAELLSVDRSPTVVEGNELVSVEWTVRELVPHKLRYDSLIEQHYAVGGLEQSTINTIDLDIARVQNKAATLILDQTILKPGHYYEVSLKVEMKNPLRTTFSQFGSDTALAFVKRPALNPTLIISEDRVDGRVYPPLDNSFVTVLGQNLASNVRPFRLNVSLEETSELKQLASWAKITFSWNCRKWERGNIEYWRFDDDIVATDERLSSKCFFNNSVEGMPYPATKEEKEAAFPCCNRPSIFAWSVELEDRMTYEFSLTLSVEYATSPSEKMVDNFQVSRRVTIQRQDADSKDFFTIGRTIEVKMDKAGDNHLYKVVPNSDLVLYASVPKAGVERALESWGGKCEHPSRPGQPACRLTFTEVAQGLDTQNLLVTGSSTSFNVDSYPSFMSFRINPEMVAPGSRFVFRLNIETIELTLAGDVWQERGYAEIMLEVNRSPRNGQIVVSPMAGKAYDTKFELQASHFEDDAADLPLLFEFSYQVGDSDLVYITDSTPDRIRMVTFPMLEQMASDSPCEYDSQQVPGGPCSTFRVFVLVSDVYGAQTTSNTTISLTLVPGESISYLQAYNNFLDLKRQAFLSKDIVSMCNTIKRSKIMLQHPSLPTLIAQQMSEDPLAMSLERFQRSLADTLVDIIGFQNSEFVQLTPKLSYMLSEAVADAISLHDALSEDQFDKLYQLVEEMVLTMVGSKQRDFVLLSVLKVAAQLTKKSLSRFNVAGLSRRRLLQIEADQAVEKAFTFLQQIITPVCTSALIGASMEASGAINFDTELFTTTCLKISKVSALTTKTEYCSVPSSTKCDRVDITLEGWSSNLDIDLSTTVFKYNPVSFSGIKTGDGLIDGTVHQQYGIQWPLHQESCPVLIRHAVNNVQVQTPYDAVKIVMRVPVSAARSTFKKSKNPYVFQDLIFSATCQQWFASTVSAPGAWYVQNGEANIKESDDSFVCSETHAPANTFTDPKPLASGQVLCSFGIATDPTNHVRSGLYAVITEESDCAGDVDLPARKQEGIDWPNGQFAFVSTDPSPRRVCDRCKKCGALNDCTLTCSSKLDYRSLRDYPESLDLCGVCGGVCTYDMGCSPIFCANPYFRYLGNAYPNDLDVQTDGRTTGLLKKGAGCPQTLGASGLLINAPPASSPNGECVNLNPDKLLARLERYPYNNLEKICWENSPMVPLGHADKECSFADGSLRLDDPSNRINTLDVSVLDENGLDEIDGTEISDKLVRAGAALTFAGNGSRTLVQTGPPAGVVMGINKLRYLPPLNWNSKYPPTRRRKIRFKVRGSQVPALVVEVRIRPVNDPPRITASTVPYRVQEDRISRLGNPPVQIVDDADDVQGHNINVLLEVAQPGALIRTASKNTFSRTVSIHGSLSFVNNDLSTLDYLGPDNSNDKFNPKDEIQVVVNDNGYGGEAPYNVPMQSTLIVNLTTVIQNDPPIALIEKEQVVFEGGEVKIRGAHIVDPDAFQHAVSLYSGTLSADHGTVSVNSLRVNCTVLASKPTAYRKPKVWKYVDQLMPTTDAIVQFGVGYLKLDGRVGNLKAIYLNFEMDSRTTNDVLAYSGVKFVLSIYKQDCYDPTSDQGLASKGGFAGDLSKKRQCFSSGTFAVSAVDCQVGSQTEIFSFNRHKSVKDDKVHQIGVARFTKTQSEWIYAELDSARSKSGLVSRLIPNQQNELCLRLEHDKDVNDTLRIIAPVAAGRTSQPMMSSEEAFYPRLDVFMGVSTNTSFLPDAPEKKCLVEVKSGAGVQDKKFRAQGDLVTMNKLVEEIQYGVTGKFSNRLGGVAEHVMFAIEDLSARASCEAAAAEFGYQACSELNHANATILIIPIKDGEVPMRMQPWYADRWLRVKSKEGKLPAIVALEDCGNRGWEEECPYKLQIVPDDVPGEYEQGRITVEISSRSGTVTIPEELRSGLKFEKGSGFRDKVLRVTGFAPAVRKAILEITYHSALDKHVQYRNLYSEEEDVQNLACSRLCFTNDIGPALIDTDLEAKGCNKGCAAKIEKRVNKQMLKAENGETTRDESGVFLDDLTITFTDNGCTGVGLDKYTTILLYNIYTIAINDKPCVIFKGKISQGCRKDCANMGMPNNCDDSGLPFDIKIPFVTELYEGQSEPILVGGLVSKVVDEYEYSRRECRTQLDLALSERSDEVANPSWLIECPRLNVRLAADQGAVALNSREYIELYLGADKTFASPIAFLGYPLDSNSATRMIRYKMAEDNPYFNSNQGTEILRVVVSDQGFSGADASGEFDGTASESILEFEINIKPVNNLPEITVPRAADAIEIEQNVPTQMSKRAIPAEVTVPPSEGLTVRDRDSQECVADGQGFGTLTIILKVPHGRIFVNPSKSETLEALPGVSAENLMFYLNPSCKEIDCKARLTEMDCISVHQCAWDPNQPVAAEACSCKQAKLGKKCQHLKIRGVSDDIRNAMKVVVYSPEPNKNYLSFDSDDPEHLKIEVTDKRDPDDENNNDVSCGETLVDVVNKGWVEDQATVKTLPVSQPAIVTIDPPLVNPNFEFPVLCEGNKDCDDNHLRGLDGQFIAGAQCVGVELMDAGKEPSPPSLFGWRITSGVAGISYIGWRGDIDAAEGQQHLFLSPSAKIPTLVTQTIRSMVLGARYKVLLILGARITANRGSAFKLTLYEDIDFPHHDLPWTEYLPTIEESIVMSLPGRETFSRETSEFLAYRTEVPLELKAEVTSSQLPSDGRMVFVDDVRVKFVKYNMLEDNTLAMKAVRVEDSDYTGGVIASLRSNGFDFDVKISIEAKYGVFVLISNECTVAPPNEFMDDDKRIRWGLKCWDFTKDKSISEWANTTLFRPDCPNGWAGKGTQAEPCVNVPLTFFGGSFSTPYLPQYYDLPNPGQSQIPQKSIELIGQPENLEHVIRNQLLYRPDEYFNTDNLGKEVLSFTSNDLGNFNGDSSNPNIRVQNFIVDITAVNNPPNITFSNTDFEIWEDTEIVLEGVSISDPDINELECKAEPCESVQGYMVMQTKVSNGSLIVSPETVVRDFTTVRDKHLGLVMGKDPIIQECVMVLSCTELSGYLTLGSRTLTEYCNLYPERCQLVTMYCKIAEMASSGRLSAGQCVSAMNAAGLARKLNSVELYDAETQLQNAIWYILGSEKIPVLVIGADNIIVAGTMRMLNAMLADNAITYKPTLRYNGIERVRFEVNDLGNKGIGAPCGAPSDRVAPDGQVLLGVPPELMFAYCQKKRPHWPLTASQSFDINVKAVNNRPELLMYDDFGSKVLDDLQAMNAQQNISKILNKMQIKDDDVLETAKCMMIARLESRGGGRLFFNASKAPVLLNPGRLTQNPTKTDIQVTAELRDMQIFMANIEYQSDPQFSGIESLILSISDRGCTGANRQAAASDFETFLLQIVVSRPKLCRFETCETCVKSVEEDCGWCPSSCKGRGKCKEAKGRGLGPKIGDCPPKCAGGVCLAWNQCQSVPDQSWRIGAFGSPILFVCLIQFYFIFMWSRRHYGTFPLYVRKGFISFGAMTRKFSFAPQEHARMGQLMYLGIAVVLGIFVPSLTQVLLRAKSNVYTVGDALDFTLQTDACDILFVSDPSFKGSDPVKIETQITGNGSLAQLQDVMIITNFCDDSQFIKINNSRLESVRYSGYVCNIFIRIPKDEGHSIPTMKIINKGNRATSIRTSSDDQVVNFEPNVLTVEGTLISINIVNLRLRRFQANIEKGDIRVHNMTFDAIDITTIDADIALSSSARDGMFVPIDVNYRQDDNKVCFISAKLSPDVFYAENTCQDTLTAVNVTTKTEDVINGELKITYPNVTTQERKWECSRDSKITLIPFKRDLQPGLAHKSVQLRSQHGQIYFQSVPPDRVPPRSGRDVFDNLYIYDGLDDLGYRENLPQNVKISRNAPSIEAVAASTLESNFRPGGASRPKEDWLELRLQGPGTPIGTYVWVADIRYLVIPREMLQILSLGLLVPDQNLATVRLRPSFCPEFDAGTSPIGLEQPKKFLFIEEKQALFAVIDSNADGALSTAEFAAGIRNLLKAVEKDYLTRLQSMYTDGSLETSCVSTRCKDDRKAKLNEVLAKWETALSSTDIKKEFDKLDINIDGEVSKDDEFMKYFNEYTYVGFHDLITDYFENSRRRGISSKGLENGPAVSSSEEIESRSPERGLRREWSLEGGGIGNSQYITAYYNMLFAGVKGTEMPSTSYIAFKPRTGPFIIFEQDPITGLVVPKQVLLSDYPLIVALLAFGILVPGIVSIVLTVAFVLRIRYAIKGFRQSKYTQEIGSRRLLNCLKPSSEDENREIEREVALLIYAKTNLFYFIDNQIADPEVAASAFDQIIFSTAHFGTVVLSFLPVLIFSLQIGEARRKFQNASHSSVEEMVIIVFISIHCFISVFELYSHYANLQWSPWRKLLRLSWYATQSLLTFASVFYLCTVVTWIFIGLLISPSQFLPYVTGFICALFVHARFWYRSAKTNERMVTAIRSRAERLSERNYSKIPVESVLPILDKTLEKVMKKYGLTTTSLVNQSLALFLFTGSTLSFLFIGFHALTDVTNIYIGIFNSTVIAFVLLAIDRVVNAQKDKEIQAFDIMEMVKEAISDVMNTIQFLSKQVDMGVLLMQSAAKVSQRRFRFFCSSVHVRTCIF